MLACTGSQVQKQVNKHIAITGSDCSIAYLNSLRKTVVAGPRDGIDLLADSLKPGQMRLVPLDMTYVFYTSQFNSLAGEFLTVTDLVFFKRSESLFGSTLFGCFIVPGAQFPADYLVRHSREPARFEQVLTQALASGLVSPQNVWMELGPSAMCLSFVKNTLHVKNEHSFSSCPKSPIRGRC